MDMLFATTPFREAHAITAVTKESSALIWGPPSPSAKTFGPSVRQRLLLGNAPNLVGIAAELWDGTR
ncbi:hypothetical protein E4U54_006521, partial [Claviceps lovelessii]